MSVYPKQIVEIWQSKRFSGRCPEENATGKAASFVCGSFVRFGLRIDPIAKRINEIRYTTNGCAFALATAEMIATELQNTKLTDLHGTVETCASVGSKLGEISCGREHCIDMAVEAFRASLANFRERMVEEFQGEKALICTCFGVTEETIVKVIEKNHLAEVADVSAICNAGSGCGSCQMLIRDLIDASRA